jgi:aspartyl-tRNA(Asn)/glutamyl-tRNA(Gln) amidotransferase subunit A
VAQGMNSHQDQPTLGVVELLRAFKDRSRDPVEATEACLDRIAGQDGQINAFVWVDDRGARRTAAERANQLRKGVRIGPLHGLPIAVKELVDVFGAPSEYSSQTRVGARATADAAVVQLLRRAGAVIIGSTRSHEFGWGITTQHSVRGGTRNPRALDRVPGGSSGGAAAAVAAGMVPACVATDTGGSVRIPSAYCGVAGVKPTLGTVPVAGVVPLAPSLDTVGVIARHSADLWPILRVMQGRDDPGPSTVPRPPAASLWGRSIGFAPSLIGDCADPARLAQYENALAMCGEAGARVSEVTTASAELFRSVFVVVQGFEAVRTHSQVLRQFPGRKDEYGADVAGRLEAATSITLAEYLAALAQMKALTSRLAMAMAGVEAILTPIALVPPPFLANADTVLVNDVPVDARDAIMPFTVPQNVAGLPTVAFPAGLATDGLPFGLQVTGSKDEDKTALELAELLERLLDDGGF